MRAPDASTITQQDVFFGLVAETPLGIISIGPAIGTHDERKLVFTIGKFF
jgi:NTE family protein